MRCLFSAFVCVVFIDFVPGEHDEVFICILPGCRLACHRIRREENKTGRQAECAFQITHRHTLVLFSSQLGRGPFDTMLK